jgi:hypothetical protein
VNGEWVNDFLLFMVKASEAVRKEKVYVCVCVCVFAYVYLTFDVHCGMPC